MSNWLKNPFVMFIAGAGIFAAGVAIPQFDKEVAFTGRSVSSQIPDSKPVSFTQDGLAALKRHEATIASISEIVSKAVVHVKSDQGGEGSGFIFKPNGWIVTNDHVVTNSKKVLVVLNDGRELEGTVTRANDPQIDLAIIKVEAKNLPFLSLADSNETKVGQLAIAVGTPFGLENTVTIGHVSALGRYSAAYDPRVGQRAYAGLIQTDAAINPGNSGGPLINTDGEVIGVNSTILSTTRASAGIGFAIPSNVVGAVAEELIKTGAFDRGLLGAFIADPKPYLLKELDIESGAQVEEVQPGGPADDAGLKAGDIIVALNHEHLANEMDLRIGLYEVSPGDKVSLTYVRDGKEKSASVTLAEPQIELAQNEQPQVSPEEDFMRELLPDEYFDQQAPPQDENVTVGVKVRNLDSTMLKQFNIPENTKGVVVTLVSEGSYAESIGLQQGDVITTINDVSITDVDSVTEALDPVKPGSSLSISYLRFGKDGMKSFSITRPIH